MVEPTLPEYRQGAGSPPSVAYLFLLPLHEPLGYIFSMVDGQPDRGSKMAKMVSNIHNVERLYNEYAEAARSFASFIVVLDSYTKLDLPEGVRDEIVKLRTMREAWQNEAFMVEADGE